MYETKKRATKKQIGRWALEAILPTILIVVGVMQIDYGLSRLYPHIAEGIVQLLTGVFVIYAAIFYLLARLEQRLSRSSETMPARR